MIKDHPIDFFFSITIMYYVFNHLMLLNRDKVISKGMLNMEYNQCLLDRN